MLTSFDQVQIESDPFRYCIKTWFNQKAFPFDTYTWIVITKTRLSCLANAIYFLEIHIYTQADRHMHIYTDSLTINNKFMNKWTFIHIDVNGKVHFVILPMSHVLNVTMTLNLKITKKKNKQEIVRARDRAVVMTRSEILSFVIYS